MNQWLSVTVGRWKLSYNTSYGGSQIHEFIDGIGWVLARNQPRKHVDRRLVKKAVKKTPYLFVKML